MLEIFDCLSNLVCTKSHSAEDAYMPLELDLVSSAAFVDRSIDFMVSRMGKNSVLHNRLPVLICGKFDI
jgi:hypothetical protein